MRGSERRRRGTLARWMNREGTRLHLGCGRNIMDGWIDVDSQPLPGVDHVHDVRDGLPVDDVKFIFAEHFIEHLTYDEALTLLVRCRDALRADGVLRLSTPNLDWVWVTSYSSRYQPTSSTTALIDSAEWSHDDAAALDCLRLNRAFRGWGHKFLWNAAMLEVALRHAGFAELAWRAYGQSDHPELAGIERHRQYDDLPTLSHLIVVEATGMSESRTSAAVSTFLDEYRRDVSLV